MALSLLPLGWASSSQIKDLEASYQFLVSQRLLQGGVLYTPTSGSLSGASLPLSFVDSEEYWGAYVCASPNTNCAVADYYDPNDYSLKPRKGEAGFLQVERVNVHTGTNIYDAATWQIAVMLGAVVNRFGNSLNMDAYGLVTNQNRVLSAARGGPNAPLGSRATTSGEMFRYNGHVITDAKEAFSFRMTGSAWLADDPLRGSHYMSLISTSDLPANNPQYQAGRIAWSDWKPIMGDNAWAHLLGPLHSAYLHFIQERKGQFVPFNEQSVQNALAVLPTFAAMQGPSGAVYYAPAGTLRNEGDQPVNPYFASVENNFSLYAGLSVLEATLHAELTAETQLPAAAKDRIARALDLIHTLVSGGVSTDHRTKGLLQFFHDCAWHDGEFVQGGFADDPASPRSWVPVLEPKAVDVNTWGVAALGASRIDQWFGFGAAYRVWKSVKSWGAYGVDHSLWGVGYSDKDGNGVAADGTYRQGILSGEWTAGAIVMVRSLIKHYHSVDEKSPNRGDAQQYEVELRQDEQALLQGVQTLRFDRYGATAFPGKPDHYSKLIAEPLKPYLYASRRYRIPFGWYANPIPSTASTSWILMIADDYDPFGYGGAPN